MGTLEIVERAQRFWGDPYRYEIGKNAKSTTLNSSRKLSQSA